MRVFVSIVVENFSAMRTEIRGHGRPPPGALGSPQPLSEALLAGMGGRVLELDWPTARVVAEHPVPTPAGLALWRDEVLVASKFSDHLATLSGHRIDSPVLNDAHGLHVDEAGIWVACAGNDSVHRLADDGTPTWSWWANDHGLDRDPTGQRVTRATGQARRATLRRAAHPNSVLPGNEGTLATLFHQGSVVRIGPTGTWSTVLGGLDHPHSIRRTDEGYSLCDSGRGRVLLLDEGFGTTGGFDGMRWVQDAVVTRDDVIALDVHFFGRGVRDPVGNRVVGLRSGACLELPVDWRPAALLVLDD